ncbi:MAG: hypothetical protein LBP53_03375 [Candidatus Peribacteria bacterium]|jgi:hypothetical protein|nr:hypothetical protein [Candidatus Peribacteria bacterium]
MVVSPLPFSSRLNGDSLALNGVQMKEIFDIPPIFQQSKRKSYILNRKTLINSEYSQVMGQGAESIGCEDFTEMSQQIETLIKS